MKMQVKYAVQYETFEVTKAEHMLILNLYSDDKRVTAIKFLRFQYGLGLKEAKDICDAIGNGQ